MREGRRRKTRGQALVELAITLPLLILLVAGLLELGRGYSFGVATSDAARDAARYIAGKTSSTNGPGIAMMCKIITADLQAVTTNISCATLVAKVPPLTPGADYPKPVPGQVTVGVYCGASADCSGSITRVYNSLIAVYVSYGFSDLNILGGGITITGSSRATTSW